MVTLAFGYVSNWRGWISIQSDPKKGTLKKLFVQRKYVINLVLIHMTIDFKVYR